VRKESEAATAEAQPSQATKGEAKEPTKIREETTTKRRTKKYQTASTRASSPTSTAVSTPTSTATSTPTSTNKNKTPKTARQTEEEKARESPNTKEENRCRPNPNEANGKEIHKLKFSNPSIKTKKEGIKEKDHQTKKAKEKDIVIISKTQGTNQSWKEIPEFLQRKNSKKYIMQNSIHIKEQKFKNNHNLELYEEN